MFSNIIEMNKSICFDGFWNYSLINRHSKPELTLCFQYFLLNIPPTILILSLVLFLMVSSFRKSKKIMKLDLDVFYIIKLFIQMFIIILLVMEVCIDVFYLEDVTDPLEVVSFTTLSISIVVVMLITEIRRRTMHPICPILFLYWVTFLICYLVRLYCNIIRLRKVPELELQIPYIVLSSSVLFLVFISFLSESTSRFTKERSLINKTEPCPEEYSSILSKLTYSWLDKYIYRWYKQDMTESTVFSLRREEECTHNTLRVENMFKEKLKRSLNYQNDSSFNRSNVYSNSVNDDQESLIKNTKEKKISKFILFGSLIKVFYKYFIVSWTFKLIHDAFYVILPFLLKVLINYVSEKSNPMWQGYILAVAFLVCGSLSSLLENYCFFLIYSLSIRLRSCLIGLIYRKALKLSNNGRDKYTSGEIVNYMSVDAERIMNWATVSWFIISCPLQIIAILSLLYIELGFSVFAGLGVIILLMPVNAAVMKYSQSFSESELEWKDKRTKYLSEIFNGIKVLKMYAWEPSFSDRVSNIRETELKYIFRGNIGWNTINVIWEIQPFMIMLVTFLVYVYSSESNVITAEKAFVSLALFNILRFPMTILPWGITETINSFVSIKRITEFMIGEEIDRTGINQHDDISPDKRPDDVVLTIENGTFGWKKDERVILNNLNMSVTRGKLIAVVGKIGTGKSSLLSAILGEMNRIDGSVNITGDISYVPQESWIQNMTLKENVLFMKDYDPDRYQEVLEACALLPDLQQLAAGDETEIGERGINLSGGQKQRISLARAVYQNNDIYLLDDPLSAVDVHVGMHLFSKVISNNGMLKNKTRILVTHGLHWLPKVDEIIVLGENGSITERGSYQELTDAGGEFHKFIQDFLNNQLQNTNNASEDVVGKVKKLLTQISQQDDNADALEEFIQITGITETPPQSELHQPSPDKNSEMQRKLSAQKPQLLPINSSDADVNEVFTNNMNDTAKVQQHRNYEPVSDKEQLKKVGELTEEETAMKGHVEFSTYWMYFMSWGRSIFLISLIFYAIFSAIQIYGNLWLEKFTSDSAIINASDYIAHHTNADKKYDLIIRDRTNYYMIYYSVIGAGELITLVIFWTFFTIGITKASKILHINLLVRIFRSPMSFFDTTPTGRILNRFSKDMDSIDHIIPYNLSDCFMCLFAVVGAFIAIIIVTPWFAIVLIPVAFLYYLMQKFYMPTCRQSRRLSSIAASPIFNHFTETLHGVSVIRAFNQQERFHTTNQNLIDRSSTFLFIQYASTRWFSLRLDFMGSIMTFFAVLFCIIQTDLLTGSLVGLSISYSLTINENLNWMIRQYTDLETNSVAIERVREYSQVPSEAAWQLEPSQQIIISDDWPPKGDITFNDICLRYREELPLVLNKISLQIRGGERLGVVGRTGAGKSSLIQALLRLVELDSGNIMIDNVDISKLGLHQLRRRLTILPQDPVIFVGSIRDNLDPFGEYSDEKLHEVLKQAHLSDWVQQVPGCLAYECGEGGANLSAGQRQLLCLSRALLRRSRVLVLDEATAAVDVETDRLVMQTVREFFHDSTVIIIAHRINTIMDCDRIVVLETGNIVEFDEPRVLMQKDNGVFRALAEQSADNTIL